MMYDMVVSSYLKYVCHMAVHNISTGWRPRFIVPLDTLLVISETGVANQSY